MGKQVSAWLQLGFLSAVRRWLWAAGLPKLSSSALVRMQQRALAAGLHGRPNVEHHTQAAFLEANPHSILVTLLLLLLL